MLNIKKNRYLLFLAFLLLFIFISSTYALALEVKYPNIPGLPSLSKNPNPGIGEYVGYFFGLGIYMAGILALISFTLGAVGLIASADNAEATSNAKDRMKGAVLGLVLVFASFIIIRTINPTLINPALSPLPGVAGIFYTNGSDQKQCPEENPDTATIPKGFNKIQYTCSDNSDSNPYLLIWMFPNTNFLPIETATVKRVKCNSQEVIAGKSYKMAFETPGVYYCLGGCGGGNMCSGYMSGAITNSQDNIGVPFSGKIQGVRIVNGPTGGPYYGVIFHKEIGLANGGKCNNPIINQGPGTVCKPVANPASTSAVDIFTLNETPGSSGDGVSFYSEPFGWNTGANAGFKLLGGTEIKYPPSSIQAGSLNFNYIGVSRPNEYQNICGTFQKCPGSIKINGSYLVAPYSGESTNPYCQTFNLDVPNLKAQPIIASGGGSLSDIYIIPTK
jgi:hypothetical protein